jgi:hypothetical protein
MLDPSRYENVSEFYVIEKSIEIVAEVHGQSETIRIDALRQVTDHGTRYLTRGFIELPVVVQPVYGPDGTTDTAEPREVRAWVAYNIPWTDGDSADSVLGQAIAFLRRSSL